MLQSTLSGPFHFISLPVLKVLGESYMLGENGFYGLCQEVGVMLGRIM